MSYQSAFNRKLDSLFRTRTDWLRHRIGHPRKGKTPVFNRKRRERGIKRLIDIASKALIAECTQKEFLHRVEKRRRWYPKKHKTGRDAKKLAFKKWYDGKFKKESCIYIFWANGKCLYVGKTGRGPGRIVDHFEKYWFSRVTRIDVYMAHGKKDLPSLECLAIHRFKPKENDMKAAKKKGAAKCILCISTRQIRGELRRIFPLK